MPTLTTKITGSNNYLSLISLNINGLNSPIKRHRLTDWLHKQDPTFCCLQETHLREKDRHYLRVKGWKTIFQANGLKKQAGVAILISDKIDFQPKVIKKDKEGHFILIKGKILQEELSILNIYAQEMEERISGAEDSIENIGTTIKENGKCKKILTQNIQEIQDTMRRPNLRIIGVDENEDFQLKGPANIFNKIIEENFPNIKKEIPMNIQEAYRTPNRLDQKRNSSRHIIIRTTNALNKDRILKAVREKGQVTYKGKPIRITPDFSPETMKARRAWTDVIQTLREHKFQPRLLYPAKLSITIDGETKVFHDKTKFTHYLSTNPALQRLITEKNQYKNGNNALEKTRR
ncbi:exonuclease III [Chlamydia trachomatis]|nr:exonuclease III [Chlamydia trachomatis]